MNGLMSLLAQMGPVAPSLAAAQGVMGLPAAQQPDPRMQAVGGAMMGGGQQAQAPLTPMTQPLPMQIQPLMPQYDFQRFYMGGMPPNGPPGLLG